MSVVTVVSFIVIEAYGGGVLVVAVTESEVVIFVILLATFAAFTNADEGISTQAGKAYTQVDFLKVVARCRVVDFGAASGVVIVDVADVVAQTFNLATETGVQVVLGVVGFRRCPGTSVQTGSVGVVNATIYRSAVGQLLTTPQVLAGSAQGTTDFSGSDGRSQAGSHDGSGQNGFLQTKYVFHVQPS